MGVNIKIVGPRCSGGSRGSALLWWQRRAALQVAEKGCAAVVAGEACAPVVAEEGCAAVVAGKGCAAVVAGEGCAAVAGKSSSYLTQGLHCQVAVEFCAVRQMWLQLRGCTAVVAATTPRRNWG